MKKVAAQTLTTLGYLIFLGASSVFAGGAVVITEPANDATISSPVKVCMEVHGIEVEPAKNGVNEGKGHHHIIINHDLPEDLTQPVGKDLTHIHMGDGSTCKEGIKMGSGKHVIRALFAQGNHIPVSPTISATIFVVVK
jgi:hypothetical protein